MQSTALSRKQSGVSMCARQLMLIWPYMDPPCASFAIPYAWFIAGVKCFLRPDVSLTAHHPAPMPHIVRRPNVADSKSSRLLHATDDRPRPCVRGYGVEFQLPGPAAQAFTTDEVISSAVIPSVSQLSKNSSRPAIISFFRRQNRRRWGCGETGNGGLR